MGCLVQLLVCLLLLITNAPQSSQLIEPLWADPGLKREIVVHEPRLIHQKSSSRILICEEKAIIATTVL